MFFSTAVAGLFLLSVGLESVEAQTCVDFTFSCSDCTSLIACYGGIEYPIPCGSGQVCGNNGDSTTIDGCFDVTDSANKKLSQCSCDASSKAASYIADPYNPAAYLACLPEDAAPQSLLCTGTDVFLDGQIPPCGPAPPTTPTTTIQSTTTAVPFACTDIGFYSDTSDCSKYWLCTSATDMNPVEANCPAGLVFNEATLGCFDPCDSSAVSFSCDGITGGVPDSVNCTIFHVCINGNPIGQPIPCPGGTFVDPVAIACTLDACPIEENSCFACSAPEPASRSANQMAFKDVRYQIMQGEDIF